MSGTGSAVAAPAQGVGQPGTRSGLGAPSAGQTCNALAWAKWQPLMDSATRHLSQRMIALAGIGKGDRVLDVGTGIGDPALAAAMIVGPGGHVTAIDPDPQMIKEARARAQSNGIGNVTFHVTREEDLDLPPGSVDAILCRWSLMFVDDPGATLGRLHRLLRPGGHLVAATWGPPERVPALSLARWTIHRHLGRQPPPQGAKTAFALSDSNRLADVFRQAGFRGVSQEWISLSMDFRDMMEYVEFRTDCTGPLFSGVGEVTEMQRQSALGALEAALAPFRGPDGRLSLVNDCCCTTARAAGS